MAKKQSSNERDMENMLDMLKRSVENEDDTDADYADEDINTGSDDEDFDAYLANLIGKQISDIDSDIPERSPQSDDEDDEAYFDEFDEITEESAVDDKTDDVADDVPFDTVEETVIEEDIEEILEEKFEDEIIDAVDEEILSDEACDAQEIEELVQNEASADDYYAEEEIDEAAEEAAYLAYLATLTAQEAPDSSIQQIADEKESFDEIEDVIDEPVEEEIFEDVDEPVEEEIFEDVDESIEEEIFEDVDESVEEEIFEDVDGEIVEDFQEESDEPFVEIPEHIVIDSVDDFSDNAIEPISENQEDAADIAFVDEESIDEDIEEVELPIYSVERQRQIKQSRVESDSAVELEDEDVERLMGLGYERELVDQIGLERYEKIRRKIAARGAKRSNISGAFATDGDEFVSKSQVKPISERYHKERTSLIIRLLASSFVALLILIFNEPSIFGVDSFFGISYISKPWVCSLVGLQLLLVAIYRFQYYLRDMLCLYLLLHILVQRICTMVYL